MTNIPLYVFLFFVQTYLADDLGIRRITRKVPQDTSEHIGRFLTINRSSRRTKAPRSGANKENEKGQDYWTTEDGKQVTYCNQGTQFDRHLSFTRRTQSQAQNKKNAEAGKGGKMASTCQVRSSSCETFIQVSEINLCKPLIDRADFPAVFIHIFHWYLSWNTVGGGDCRDCRGGVKCLPPISMMRLPAVFSSF